MQISILHCKVLATAGAAPVTEIIMVPNFLPKTGNLDREFRDARPSPGRTSSSNPAPINTHFELARVLERVSRRFSAFMQAEMTKLGIEEIGPSHLMLLLAIGTDEISVSQLIERGPYAGTNLSTISNNWASVATSKETPCSGTDGRPESNYRKKARVCVRT